MVPGYLGWIAAQYTALAVILAGATGLPVALLVSVVALALGAGLLVPDAAPEGILAALAAAILHPAIAWIFTLTVAAAVLSSIDSGILAPATVLARNVVVPLGASESVRLHRVCVAIIALAALVIAYIGDDTYTILEASYEIGMVSLLVPLVMGVYRPRGPLACLWSMAVGTTLWLGHLVFGVEGLFGTELPKGLGSMVAAWLAYLVIPGPKPEPPAE